MCQRTSRKNLTFNLKLLKAEKRLNKAIVYKIEKPVCKKQTGFYFDVFRFSELRKKLLCVSFCSENNLDIEA